MAAQGLGVDGGFIFSPGDSVLSGFPMKNIDDLFETAEK